MLRDLKIVKAEGFVISLKETALLAPRTLLRLCFAHSTRARRATLPSDPAGAVFLPISVFDPARVYFDEHDPRRLDALRKPAVEIFDPVLPKQRLVLEEFGLSLGRDEYARLPEQARRFGKGQTHASRVQHQEDLRRQRGVEAASQPTGLVLEKDGQFAGDRLRVLPLREVAHVLEQDSVEWPRELLVQVLRQLRRVDAVLRPLEVDAR